jgi:hypothetical protein
VFGESYHDGFIPTSKKRPLVGRTLRAITKSEISVGTGIMNILRVFLRGRGMGGKWGFCDFLRGFRGFWIWESRFWPLLGAKKPSLGAEKPLNGRVLTSLGAKKPLSNDFQFLIFNFQFSRSRGREKVVMDEGHGLLPFWDFLLGVL